MSEQVALELVATPAALSPAIGVREAAQRYKTLVQFTETVLREDVDYGHIPGTGAKPALLKPGAEKLCFFFGLTAEFELDKERSVEDWETGFFHYRYECRLIHRQTGQYIGNAFGSANSREKKYRWRYVPEFKASQEEKAAAVRREERTSRNGNTYTMLILENAEPYDLVNTLDKMAQKRALVAAVLVGVGASEFYTQDLEDFGGVPGDGTPAAPPRKARPKRQKKAEPEAAQENGSSPWHERATLISAVRDSIPYYNAPKHIINTLKKLEQEGEVGFDQTDAELYEALTDYAKERTGEESDDA